LIIPLTIPTFGTKLIENYERCGLIVLVNVPISAILIA